MIGFLLSALVLFNIVLGVGFWLLFWLVVNVRLADNGIQVEEVEDRWDFLIYPWPYAELRAYEKLLTAAERNRWFNWYLLNASTIFYFCMLPFAGLLLLAWATD